MTTKIFYNMFKNPKKILCKHENPRIMLRKYGCKHTNHSIHNAHMISKNHRIIVCFKKNPKKILQKS
jgi:hypothetical protein